MMSMIASQVGAFGNILVVMNSANSDEKNYQHLQDLMDVDPDGNVRFFTSLESAYAAAESNNNDVILLDSNSSHTLVNGIAWSKNRIHVIGMDGGDRLIQQGAKVQCTSGTGDAYVIKVTGVRNSFRNVKFIQNDVTATSLHVLEEGGEGNLYKNCTFTFGVVDNLDLTTATEVLCGSDSATFINCEFGTETLLTSAARTVFTVDQVTASQEFKSNRIIDCNFVISSSETTATLLSIAAATDVLFTNNFKNCTFVASIDSAGGVALAVGVKSVASLVKGTLNFHDCAAYGCTNFASDAVGNDNFYVYGAPNATGTDFVGLLPVAT
jgi:hypothetical protein